MDVPALCPCSSSRLEEVWRRREDYRLTVRTYREIGQIKGALQRKADAVYDSFTPEQQELCRRVFLRLVQPGEGSEDTRRRASLRELLPDDPTQAGAVQTIVGRLTDPGSRLLTTERQQTTSGEGTLEVAHEALIIGWPRLREWIDADRAGLRTQRRLTDATREWEAHSRDKSFLYAGVPLMTAQEWAKTHRDGLSHSEAEFLAASMRRRFSAKVARVASVAALFALICVLWGWLLWQRQIRFTNLSKATNEAVEEGRQLSLQSRWDAAIKVLQAAESQLESGREFEQLRRQVAGALASYKKRLDDLESQERDRRMVEALDEAHMLGAGASKYGDKEYDHRFEIAEFRRVFREGGVDLDVLPPETIIALIRSKSPIIRESLAAALEEIAEDADETNKSRLRSIIQAADPDPYRCRIRKAKREHDVQTLQAMARDPEVAHQAAETLHHLGHALADEGDREGAKLVYRNALHLDRIHFWVARHLCIEFLRSHPPQYDEAIRYMSIAVALRPDSPGANRELGRTLATSGRMEEALFFFNKVLAHDPHDALTYCDRGSAWQANQMYEKAIADYNKAIELKPGNAKLYVSRASLCARGKI